MPPVRSLALWLAAAIAVIVAGLMPSAASAHEGHRHEESSLHRVPSAPGPSVTAAVQPEAVAAARETRLQCGGPCCLSGLHACSSCCAAGLTPVELPALAPFDRPRRCRASSANAPPDIADEALPEPPRPLA